MLYLLFHFIFLIFTNLILSCTRCCNRNSKNSYEDISRLVNDIYINNKQKIPSEKVIGVFRKLSNNNTSKNNPGSQKIRLIKWENIRRVNGIDVDVTELKKQIKFVENISYIYLLEFFFRLMDSKKNVNFMLSVNGVGGPVLESTGYINLELGDILCKNKESSRTVNMDGISGENVVSGSKGIFTNTPIYDNNDDRIYSVNKNTLKLFDGKFVDLKNKENINKLLYFYSICEYLAQLGNPLFGICDGYEHEVSSIYNSLLMLDSIFGQLPFFREIDSNLIKNFDIRKGGQVEKLSGGEIYKEIKRLGAVREKDMIMLAEVIVLNNLLYYVFKSSEITDKKAIVNLAFSSYGGRVFEMLMSLFENEYSNIAESITDDKYVNVEKNSINVIFIHALIGSNSIKFGSKNSFFNINNEKIFKDIGNRIISKDRLKYFNCDNIFGNSFESIFKYYNDHINSNKINQIISKFVENKSTNSFKDLIRWEFGEALTSFYEGKYNDGVLSYDGLFVYNDNVKRNRVTDIIAHNISNPSKNKLYKITDHDIKETNYLYSTNSDNGFYIIDDQYIRYIHIGGGAHIPTSTNEFLNSFSIYENRGRFINNLLKEIYR